MENVRPNVGEKQLPEVIENNLREQKTVAEGYMPPFEKDNRNVPAKLDRKARRELRKQMTIERQFTAEGKFFHGLIYSLIRLFFRPKVYYINKEAQDRVLKRPCVIIGNHNHIADGPLIGTVMKGNINYLAAGEMYKRKALARLLYDCGCIPIARMNVDTQWVKESRKAIKAGRSICIFPEGGKYFEDFEVHKFKSGFIMIALGTDIEILPIYIDGIYYFMFGPRQRVMIGEPMKLSPINGRNLAEYVRDETKRFYDYENYLRSELIKRTSKKKDK